MKRFFCIFSIIMIVFLVLTAGSAAAVEYGALKPDSKTMHFVSGWGITLIPFNGNTIRYPYGDVFLIQQVPAQQLNPGDVAVYAGPYGRIQSGSIAAKTASGLSVTGQDGITADEPANTIIAIYRSRIPSLSSLLTTLESPLAIGVFAVALFAAIILWRVLPSGKRGQVTGLSRSDDDIATNLY